MLQLIVFGIAAVIGGAFAWVVGRTLHIGGALRPIVDEGLDHIRIAFQRAQKVYVEHIRPWCMGAGWVTIAVLGLSILLMYAFVDGGSKKSTVLPAVSCAVGFIALIGWQMRRPQNLLSIWGLVSWSAIALVATGTVAHVSALYHGDLEVAMLGAALILGGFGVFYLIGYLYGLAGKKLIDGGEGLIAYFMQAIRITLTLASQKGAADLIGKGPNLADQEDILPGLNVVVMAMGSPIATLLIVDLAFLNLASPKIVALASLIGGLSVFIMTAVGIKTGRFKKRGVRIVVIVGLLGTALVAAKLILPQLAPSDAQSQSEVRGLFGQLPVSIAATTLIVMKHLFKELPLIALALGVMFVLAMVHNKLPDGSGGRKLLGLASLCAFGLLLYKVAYPLYLQIDGTPNIVAATFPATVKSPSSKPEVQKSPDATPSATPSATPKAPSKAERHAHRSSDMRDLCSDVGGCEK